MGDCLQLAAGIFNPLVLSLKESATLAINLKALKLRRSGVDIVHFGFGQSPFPVPELLQEALRENADKKEYLPTQGLPELDEAVTAVDFDGERALETWPGVGNISRDYFNAMFPKIKQGADCIESFLEGLQ